MWEIITFSTLDEKNEWEKAHYKTHAFYTVFVNNGYAVETKELKQL